MRIALCQIHSSPFDIDINIDAIEGIAHDMGAKQCEVLVFPEAAELAFGGDLRAAAMRWDDWISGLKRAAKASHALIVAGGFRSGEFDDTRVRNTLCFVDESGLVHSYDKIHGFNAMGYREDESIQPGAMLPMPYAGLGCAICHDVRFPSMFVAQSLLGAHTIIVSASWGDGLRKADQWRTLTQARALDSCSFVVAVDQSLPSADGFPGVSGEPNGVGQSSVWAPDGELIAQLGAHQEAKVIDVPTDLIDSYRNDLRVLSNRVAGVDC